MNFDLVDKVLEQTDDRIVAIKNVTKGEEYLRDHFPTFPVMPGVLMIETLVQAARIQIGNPRLVLGEVKALRYGSFVEPGDALRVEVSISGPDEDGVYKCRGNGTVVRSGAAPPGPDEVQTAVSGRFTLRPIRPRGD